MPGEVFGGRKAAASGDKYLFCQPRQQNKYLSPDAAAFLPPKTSPGIHRHLLKVGFARIIRGYARLGFRLCALKTRFIGWEANYACGSTTTAQMRSAGGRNGRSVQSSSHNVS